MENADPKHWAYVPPMKLVAGEDGDVEVLREALDQQMEGEIADCEDSNNDAEIGDLDVVLEDGQDDLRVAEEECKDAISQMLDGVEPSEPPLTNSNSDAAKILLVVKYMEKAIYKSTLVADLNGNPFFSKDRLNRIKNSVYFNNAKEYLAAANSTTISFIRLGSDCGVLFVQSSNLNQSSAVRVAQKRNRACGQVGHPTATSTSVDVGTWWLG